MNYGICKKFTFFFRKVLVSEKKCPLNEKKNFLTKSDIWMLITQKSVLLGLQCKYHSMGPLVYIFKKAILPKFSWYFMKIGGIKKGDKNVPHTKKNQSFLKFKV